MTGRVSNEQVLKALESGFDRLITALTDNAMPDATKTGGIDKTTEGGTLDVDEKYLAHMTIKASEHATAKGEETVLYARINKRG